MYTDTDMKLHDTDGTFFALSNCISECCRMGALHGHGTDLLCLCFLDQELCCEISKSGNLYSFGHDIKTHF